MLAKYGVTQYLDGTGTDGLTYNIALAPLWYGRGGGIYPNEGKQAHSGATSYPWSRTSYSDADYPAERAYNLGFTGSYILLSSLGSRYLGFPLRCLHQP